MIYEDWDEDKWKKKEEMKLKMEDLPKKRGKWEDLSGSYQVAPVEVGVHDDLLLKPPEILSTL